jgi:UrcA family protein
MEFDISTPHSAHKEAFMNIQKISIAAATLSIAGLLGSQAALSAVVTEDNAPKIVVSYADLDLSSSKGATALLRRIDSAARRVCPDEFSRDLHIKALARECQRAATARAVAQVYNVRLSAVHAAGKAL